MGVKKRMNRTKNTKKAESLVAVHTHTHVIYGNKKIKEDRSIMPVAIVDTG